MPSIGPLELAIILVIVIVLFGAKRLPELGRQLGDGMREFKDGITRREKKPVAGELESAEAEAVAGEVEPEAAKPEDARPPAARPEEPMPQDPKPEEAKTAQ
jgi:TatA/E family protein of Tat protein translocase